MKENMNMLRMICTKQGRAKLRGDAELKSGNGIHYGTYSYIPYQSNLIRNDSNCS